MFSTVGSVKNVKYIFPHMYKIRNNFHLNLTKISLLAKLPITVTVNPNINIETLQLQVLYNSEIEELTVAKLIRNGNGFLNADFKRISLGGRSRHCYLQAFPRDSRN